MAVLDTLKKVFGGLAGRYDPRNVDTTPEVTDARLNIYRRPPARTPAFDKDAYQRALDQQYGSSAGGYNYSPITFPELNVPPVEKVVDELANRTADLVESLFNDLKEVTALAGGLTFDEDALREKALELVTPYMNEEIDFLKKDIGEGRLVSQEDLQARLNQITTEAEQQVRRLDIRQAQSTEELAATLKDIGATTQEELGSLQARLKNTLTSTEKNLLKAGIGFGGRAKETMADVRAQGAADQAAVARRGAFAGEQAQLKAQHTLQDVQDARLAVTENRKLAEGQVETLKARQERQYGTSDEDLGLYGGRKLQELQRGGEERVQSEIENLKSQKRAEVSAAMEPKKYGIQTKLNTLSAIRGGSYI